MQDKVRKRKISKREFERLSDSNNREFEVSYKEIGEIIKYTKRFKRKKQVRNCLSNPYIVDVEIVLCEGRV